jgi:monovalent cation:H+ antiporter-2, CPA2 family
LLSALELTLVLLTASVIAVVALRALRLPPLVAYLAVGTILGPHAIGLTGNADQVHGLGEIGVVFLMFSLGLEFNLTKLKTMRRWVFGLGAAQVGSTVVAVVALLVMLPPVIQIWMLGAEIDWRAAIALGGAAAMSSTALVSKLLTEKRELETEHGKRVFSVLLFQDLAVIPMLILIPALASGTSDWMTQVGLALAKAAVLLVLLLRFGPPLMRRWFNMVVKQRSHELFTLNVLLATLFFAWLTKKAGLSMELGAFVAGMLIAETEFRYQVEEDIKPFRDVLLGLFFVAVGMQLDLRVVFEAWPRVLLFVLLPVALKFLLVLALARAFQTPTGTGIRTAVWLAQGGEFGFVLLSLASDNSLLPPEVLQPVLAAMLVSLLISPLLIEQSGKWALRWSSQEWLQRSLQLQTIASRSLARSRHVLILGYGRCGQGMAHVLEAEKVATLALDLDPDRVRQAAAAGEAVVYGDASRRETLLAAGVHRAQAAVITFDDTPTALRIMHVLKELAPQLPILVRTAHEMDSQKLRDAGAAEVVPEIVEGSLMLASHAMVLAGVPSAQVQRRVAQVRGSRYQLLQGFFHGADDDAADQIEAGDRHLRAIELHEASSWVGRNVAQIGQLIRADSEHGARIAAVLRSGQRTIDPPADWVLQVGDTVVMSGPLEGVSAAQASAG